MKVNKYFCDACSKEIELKTDLVIVTINSFVKRRADAGHESFTRNQEYHAACFSLPKQMPHSSTG